MTMRGRPQIPLHLAEATGALLRNPERFVGRVENQTTLDELKLGMPSVFIASDPDLARMWSSFAREWPWLRESDRPLLEVACVLRARFIEAAVSGTERLMSNADMNTYIRIMQTCGGTPATVGKLLMPKKAEETTKKKGSKYARKLETVRAAA
jgi:hypothetical protein